MTEWKRFSSNRKELLKNRVLMRIAKEAHARGYINFSPSSSFCKKARTFSFAIFEAVTATVTLIPRDYDPRRVQVLVSLATSKQRIDVELKSELIMCGPCPTVSRYCEVYGDCISLAIIRLAESPIISMREVFAA